MKKPLIYSIIPARGGSKGVPGKNIRKLGQHPLIAYSIQASKLSKWISRTIISTDSEEIASVCKKFGAEVPFFRPENISGDKSTDYEFVEHALNWFKENEGTVPDYLVHLRPTTPIRDPQIMDQGIELFINNNEASALRSGHEMSESAYKTFEIDGGYFKSVGSGSFELDAANRARQSFPKTYAADGYVDVLKTNFILEQKRLHGSKVMGFVSPYCVEVDSLDDFDLIEFLIHKDNSVVRKLFG